MDLIFGYGAVGKSLGRYFDVLQKDWVAVEESPRGLQFYGPQAAAVTSSGKVFEDLDPNILPPVQSVFLSPGVDSRRVFFKAWAESEAREVDLFCKTFGGRILAVTGTNAKSSMVSNLGRNLQKILGEEDVLVGGNLGPPLMDLVLENPKASWAVIELSSFQLERLQSSSFDFGCLLSLSPDHLDRYESLEDYYNTKWDLIRRSNQSLVASELKIPSDLAAEDLRNFHASEEPFDVMIQILSQLQFSFEAPSMDWKPLPHRLESLGWRSAAEWINDSKATNLASTLYAFRQTAKKSESILLLLGGVDKGEDFSALKSELRPQDVVMSFGASAQQRANQLGIADEYVFKNLKSLLRSKSFLSLCAQQSTVLLSPGGASFDEFKNFEERGAFFSTWAS